MAPLCCVLVLRRFVVVHGGVGRVGGGGMACSGASGGPPAGQVLAGALDRARDLSRTLLAGSARR